MQGILLFISILVILGTSCANTSQESPSPTKRETPLELGSALLDGRYELFTVQELEMPLADHRYVLAKNGETTIKIQQAEDFSQIVKEITSAEEALELVRLITSQEIRPFLTDIYYHEVEKKVESEIGDAVEPQWFALEPEQYDKWEVQEPVVTEEGDGKYKIERFVAGYSRMEEERRIPSQLLKIWEWVDVEGNYSMKIQEVITEGEEIDKILLFTK